MKQLFDDARLGKSQLDEDLPPKVSDHVEESKHYGSEVAARSEGSPLDKKIIVKLDLLLLPVLSMVYLLAFLDRGNIGNARIAGLQADLGLTDHMYQIVITVTYAPYILTEIPSNLIIKKVGPRIYIPSLCAGWGIIATLQCLVQSYSGLIACRFFLGLMEGGLFPGIILYLSDFYQRQELSLRIALFWSAASLSSAFSGLLAAAIVNMDGIAGLKGWRWIFLIEGIFTFCWGVLTFFLLPNGPRNVRVFTPKERDRCEERLRLDIDILETEKINVNRAFSVFKDLHLILPWVCSFCSGCAIFGLAYFAPSIVRSMGFDPIHTQLMTVPPFAWACVLTVITAFLSDKFNMRGVPIIITFLISLGGCIMFLVGRSFAVRYAGLFLLLGGVYASAPIMIAWVPNNCAAHSRRATSVAMNCVMVNCGGIISTWIFPESDAPYYTLAAKLLLSLNVIAIASAGLAMLVCRHLNKQKQDPSYRERLLSDDSDLSFAQQLEKHGDHHPDFTYII